MDPVDGVGSLVRLLGGLGPGERRSAKPDPVTPQRQSVERISLSELESELKLKLKKLETDIGGADRKAKMVVESVLVWEFGDKVRNEPKFNLLIAKIYQHLNSDNRMKAAFSNFLERLSA